MFKSYRSKVVHMLLLSPSNPLDIVLSSQKSKKSCKTCVADDYAALQWSFSIIIRLTHFFSADATLTTTLHDFSNDRSYLDFALFLFGLRHICIEHQKTAESASIPKQLQFFILP